VKGTSIEHAGAVPFVAVVLTHSVMTAGLLRMVACSAAGCGQAAPW
jgi:hypothetical protein